MNKPKLSTFLPVLTALGLIARQCGCGQVTVWNLSWKPLVVQEVNTYSGYRRLSPALKTKVTEILFMRSPAAGRMKSGAAEKQAVLAGYPLANEIREYLKRLSGTCCQHWVN